MEVEDLPFLQGLSPVDRAEALGRFDVVEAEAGTQLIREGEHDDSMVIVLDGILRVSKGELELGTAEAGETVGELGLFASGARSADVTALTPARLLFLERDDVEALRQAGNPVAYAIERLALSEVTEWLLQSTDKLVAMSQGTPLEKAVPDKTFVEKLRGLLGIGGRRADPDLQGLAFMRRHRFLGDASDDAILEVVRLLEPQAWDGGTFLCTQGRLETDMYLLVEGTVQVLVDTGEERVEALATLVPGDAFGMNAVLFDSPRSASCVTEGPVKVFRLDRPRWQTLMNAHTAGGSAMRTAMIQRIAQQLARANTQLAEIEHDLRDKVSKAVRGLATAGALLESHPSMGGE